MIYTAPAFISNPRVRTTIWGVPIFRGMAFRTVGAKHSRMECRVTMTAYTGSGKPRELTIRMTLFTGQSHVPACQREITPVVVERGIIPIVRGMAGRTIGPETPVMLVVLPVTGITICRRALVHPILMTRLTTHFRMFPFQFEC